MSFNVKVPFNFQQIIIIQNANVQFRSILCCLIAGNHPQAFNYLSSQRLCLTVHSQMRCSNRCDGFKCSPCSTNRFSFCTFFGSHQSDETFLQIPQKTFIMNIVQCMFFFQSKRKNQFLLLSEICFASRLSSSIFRSRIQTKWKAKAEIYSDLIDFLAASNSSSIHTIALRYDDLCALLRFFRLHCDMCT